MVINLVNKYGVVPKDNMHESFHSNYTEDFQIFITITLPPPGEFDAFSFA